MGTLYVVATPIGNMEDITLRAIRILSEVDLIASEDTRHTGMLLKRLGLTRPQLSLHAFNENARAAQILDALDSGDVALVTDAGTPGISDPGATLVQTVVNAGYPVVPVPGPSALSAAMSVSGFPKSDVLFSGFLPRKTSELRAALTDLLRSGAAVYCFESPGRVVATLNIIMEMDAHRQVIVCREMTKLHEEIVRGTATEVAAELASRERVRGEIVLVIGPGHSGPSTTGQHLDALITNELSRGDKPAVIAKRLAVMTGLPRSEIYERLRDFRAKSPVNTTETRVSGDE